MRHILITLSILLFSSFLFSIEKKEQGNFTFPNGAKYKGELKDGIPNGQGTSTFRDGGKYVGEFREGLLNDQRISTLFDGSMLGNSRIEKGGTGKLLTKKKISLKSG